MAGHGPFLDRLVLLFIAIHWAPECVCQLINGQYFTLGLSIIDAPAPNGQHNAPGNIPIAVDISGNGKLPQTGVTETPAPAGSPLGFDTLQIYVTSLETNTNLTVSADAGFLSGEPGSTVKHLNWPIPSCIPQGQYNMSFHEAFRLNGENHYTITPVPITILNKAGTAGCGNSLALTTQSQSSNPLPASPWLDMNLLKQYPGSSTTTSTCTDKSTESTSRASTTTPTTTSTATPSVSVSVSVSTVYGTVTNVQPTTTVLPATVSTVITRPGNGGTVTITPAIQTGSNFFPANAATRLLSDGALIVAVVLTLLQLSISLVW